MINKIMLLSAVAEENCGGCWFSSQWICVLKHVEPKWESQDQLQLECLQGMNACASSKTTPTIGVMIGTRIRLNVSRTPAPDDQAKLPRGVASMLRNAGVKSMTSTAMVEVVRCAQTIPQKE